MPIDAIDVIEAAPLTTVQDLGRYGFQRYGVPVSGAMDPFALRLANLLVGNDETLAALELTLGGPVLRFLLDTVVAITGADLQPTVDNLLLPMWEAVPVHRGSTIRFRAARAGARAYLAVAGGIDVPIVLGSRSTFARSRLGGVEGRPLQAGDRLPVPQDRPRVTGRRIGRRHLPFYPTRQTLRVVPGPQYDRFGRDAVGRFLTASYTISHQSDRMGYRLEGPPILPESGADIVSDGTPSGAVQVTGDGLPIVLLADRGTAGGYAKIATVISVDVARLGQMKPGDQVRFAQVTEAEAHVALRQQEAILALVGRSHPRLFGRRLFSLRTAAGRCDAVGGFEERLDAPGTDTLPPVSVVLGGISYRIEQQWQDTELKPGAATGPSAPDERAVAALEAAVVAATDPLPRDFPLVI